MDGMMDRAFKYHLGPPTVNAELVENQLFKSHRYRNQNVGIERIRRAKTRAVLEADALVAQRKQEVKAAKGALIKTIAALNEEKVRTGKLCGSPEMRQIVADARAAHKATVTAFRGAQKAAEICNVIALDRVKLAHNALRRDARKASECYWGSYLLVEKAMRQSAGQPIYEDDAEPKDPKYVLWRREGAIGVRFQNNYANMPVERVFKENGLLMIDPVSERAWHSAIGVRPEAREHQPAQPPARHSPEKQGRRTAMRTRLRMCVFGENRKPIFAEWPMIMHRPIPAGSVMKEAYVTCKRMGSRWIWSLVIIAGIPKPVRPALLGTGTVAVNVGWRKLPSGDDRVAVWVGEDGRKGEIIVSKDMIASLRYESELRSVRDMLFNRMLAQLAEWLRGKELPEWILRATMSRKARFDGDPLPSSAQAIAWLAGWRSQARLASLTLTWAENRMPGDEQIFGRRPDKDKNGKPIKETGYGLEGWRYHDKHLWDWQSFQRYKSQNKRKEDYRLRAVALAESYDALTIISFNKSKVAKRPDEEEHSDEGRAAQDEAARSNRQLIAPSYLNEEFLKAFIARGKPTSEQDPALKTRECHLCGHVDVDGDFANSIDHVCPGCGETWDQDVNHGYNLLGLSKVKPGSTKVKRTRRAPKPGDDPNEPRHARARRLAREREQRVAAADAAAAEQAQAPAVQAAPARRPRRGKKVAVSDKKGRAST